MAKTKKKISRSSHEAQLAIARRNPAFRKAEAFERLKADVAIAYLSVAAQEGDMNTFVQNYATKLEKLGGVEGMNNFLEDLEFLVWDYEDYFDKEGRITHESIHENGYEFLSINADEVAVL